MKKIFSLSILILASFSMVLSQPVKEHGKLSVSGTQLVNEKGKPVMLQGVSYGWHNWWPRFYNKESVKWLADDWNCTVIRAAMGVGPKKSYLDEPEWSLELIEAVVEGCIENNVYVIIDWHSHQIELEAAKKFFGEMAKKYGNYPHVIYEIFNEPVNDSWNVIKDYSVEVIKTIRAIDPDNVILIGSPHWDQDVHIVADSPIQGYDNLMYTLHFYADTHKQSLRDRGNYAISKGIPLFVSESAGMAANGNGPINCTEWNLWIEWMKKNQISWVTWSVADKNETCSMLVPSASSEGGWKEDDMKESGIKTRELLRSK
jgi:endoglucanase